MYLQEAAVYSKIYAEKYYFLLIFEVLYEN